MKRFKKVYVEITNECNLSCAFCHKTKREIIRMKPDFFEHILKEIKPVTDYVYLHLMGEPLLHPQLGELLNLCEKYEIKANITTNGTKIQVSEKALTGKKALRQINYSIHCLGSNPQINQETYFNSIFRWIEKTKKDGIYHCFRLWNLKQGQKNAENEFLLRMLEKEYHMTEQIQNEWIKGNGCKLSENIFLQQSFAFLWPDKNGKEQFYEGSCFGLKDHIGILSDGRVVPCCLDCEGDLTLGNLKEMALSDILEGGRVKVMKKGFQQKKRVEKLCRTCGWNFSSEKNNRKKEMMEKEK